MPIPLLQVDAFSDTAYRGNPAGVCLLPEPGEPAWMQAVAAEMALPETAFVVGPHGDTFDLRWFTPTVEIDLCGHATLATAHVLWDRGVVPAGNTIYFETMSGRLSAAPLADGWIELDFPRWHFSPPTAVEEAERVAVERALGAKGVAASRGGRHWLVELESAAAVVGLTPDFGALALAGDMIIVTAPAEGWPDPAVDVVSRVFVPALGIPEDPVTGSAHCILGPYWAERIGRSTVTDYQASARGGLVRVEVRGERVGIAGQAVTVFEATMTDAAARMPTAAGR